MGDRPTRAYPAALVPGLLGVLVGALLSSFALGTGQLSLAFQDLPEYELWRGIVIVQVAIYFSVTAYLFELRRDTWLAPIASGTGLLSGLLAGGAILLPSVLVRVREFPLPWHGMRMLVVVLAAVLPMVLLTWRLARIHASFQTAGDAKAYMRLRRASRELLLIAALTITIGTLGSGLLQVGLDAAAAVSAEYESPLNRGHVIAYGAYFATLLLLFFAPVMAAERQAASRIASAAETAAETAAQTAGRSDAARELEPSLAEQFSSGLSVLSPLLGALFSQLPFGAS